MNLRIVGGILLIAGTSIGGGMLALPIANAATGFWLSSFFLVLCWAITLVGALFILEVNLYLPRGKNMISMAEATMGKTGLFITWACYLVLLYTLLAAYISGGADVFGHLLNLTGIKTRSWQTSCLFTLVFGLVVYGGIRKVDLANRALMFCKLGTYLVLILLITPKITLINFETVNYQAVSATLMILITSFGFAIIVPNLRDYFDDNIPLLKRVIFLGSLVPLFCYILWDAVILGTLPLEGDRGLHSLMQSPHATSRLAILLSSHVNSTLISSLFNFFTEICMLTAFLSVALCLLSFLADGTKIVQKGREGLILAAFTFLPPLVIVIFYPGAYIQALNYAGMICVILLILLPALMTIVARKKFTRRYQVFGGHMTQWIMVGISIILLLFALRSLI